MTRNPGGTLPRFLAPDLDPSRREVSLPADEARHLIRVLRLASGDLVSVFDGRGREFLARVAHAGRHDAILTLLEAITPAAEPAVPFTLVQSVLKGTSMDQVVRDATMMGAGAIHAVLSSHVAVRPSVVARADTAGRWHRIAIASAKQCRRARVPAVVLYGSLEEWLASSGAELKLLFVEPSAECEPTPVRALLGRAAPREAALIVGPEGGWTREEIDAAVMAGCLPATLGRLTLRADAVALAAIAIFSVLWEDA